MTTKTLEKNVDEMSPGEQYLWARQHNLAEDNEKKSHYGIYSLRNGFGELAIYTPGMFENKREARSPYECRCFHEDVAKAANEKLAAEYKLTSDKRKRAYEILLKEWKRDCVVARISKKPEPEKPEPDDERGEQYFWTLEDDQERGPMLTPFRQWPNYWKEQRP